MSNKEYFDYSGKCKDWPKNLKKDLDRLIEQKQKEEQARQERAEKERNVKLKSEAKGLGRQRR